MKYSLPVLVAIFSAIFTLGATYILYETKGKGIFDHLVIWVGILGGLFFLIVSIAELHGLIRQNKK